MLVWISDLGMKKGFPEITGNPVCGAKGIRTPDPLHAMEMRYQLRHSPKSALQTLYNIHRRHKSRKFRRVARTEELA